MTLDAVCRMPRQKREAWRNCWRRSAAKDLLRFSTAGSVDDGKSTLIGRMLYDSRSVYEDTVRSVTQGHGDRFCPADGWTAGGARAGNHDRRRVPVFFDAEAEVHHCGHAGARAVHAQHGDGRVDRGCGDCAGGRAQGDSGSDAPTRVHCVAAGDPAGDCRGEQDGPRGFLRGGFCGTSRGSGSAGSSNWRFRN